MNSHHTQHKTHEMLTFNSWIYCPETGVLKKGRTEHRLAPQPNLVLKMLVTSAPQVISRQAFLDAVWSDRIVNEDALSRTIAELRKLLGDSASQAKYIKTRPKKGYQFVTEVETIKTKKTQNRRLQFVTLFFLMLLVAVIVINNKNTSVNQLQNAVTNAKRVTFQPGMEHQSILSDDGQHILYVKQGSNNREIVIESLETTNNKQTIALKDHDLASPILISARHSVVMTGRNKAGCILKLYHLIEQRFSDLGKCHFNAESRTIDWHRNDHAIYYSAPNNKSVGIQAIDLDTNKSRTITDPVSLNDLDWSPKISPDGQWLSFSRGNYSVRNLWLKNLKTGEETALTNNKHYTVSHDWYDSEHLVFDSDLNGSRQLWLINILDKSTQLLGAYGAQHPSFDLARSQMAFQEVNYEANIWLYDMQSDQLERIVHSTKYDNNPSFSPDSDQFAFSSNRQDTGSIWLYDFNTDSEQLLLSIPGTKLTRPIWSKDGKFISITMNNDQGYSTVIYDLTTQQASSSPFAENHISTVFIDGSYFSLSKSEDNKDRIIHSIDGVKNVLPIESFSRFMVLSDGDLVYSKSNQDGLFHYNRTSSIETTLIPDFDRKALNLWTAVNQSVYYSQGGKQAGIWRYNLATGRQEYITSHRPYSVGPALSVNTEENKILITRTDRAESDIFISQLKH